MWSIPAASCYGRDEGSIVDVTLTSENYVGNIRDWKVRTDIENLSHHHHITFSYNDVRTIPIRFRNYIYTKEYEDNEAPNGPTETIAEKMVR